MGIFSRWYAARSALKRIAQLTPRQEKTAIVKAIGDELPLEIRGVFYETVIILAKEWEINDAISKALKVTLERIDRIMDQVDSDPDYNILKDKHERH